MFTFSPKFFSLVSRHKRKIIIKLIIFQMYITFSTYLEIVCQPPYTEIADGMVECSNSNLLGSVCTFTCRNDDFVLNGQAEAICAASDEGGAEGFWTAPPPTCDRKYAALFCVTMAS